MNYLELNSKPIFEMKSSPLVDIQCNLHIDLLVSESKDDNKNSISKLTCNKNSDSLTVGRWSEKEHMLFLEAYKLYGKDWNLIQAHIGTRNATQARSHAQKYFAKTFQTEDSTLTKTITPLCSPACGPNPKPKDSAEIVEKEINEKKLNKTKRSGKQSYNSKRKLVCESNPSVEPASKLTCPNEKAVEQINKEEFSDKPNETTKTNQLYPWNLMNLDLYTHFQPAPVMYIPSQNEAEFSTPWDRELDPENFKRRIENLYYVNITI